jgi:hypothetical protein
MKFRARSSLIIGFIMLCTSCSRTLDKAPTPAPAKPATQADSATSDLIIHLITQYPFMDYLDSILALNQDSFQTIQDLVYGLYQPGTENPGQAEFGYAFRTNVKGYIYALGVCLPTTGCRHTVTVWDSATGEVISQSHVETSTVGWNYSSEFQIGPQANLIGFDSRANGVPINTSDVRNELYLWDGIINWEPGGNNKWLFPFRWKGVTYEGWYWLNYITPQSSPPFPGNESLQNATWGSPMFGVCDLAFEPQ